MVDVQSTAAELASLFDDSLAPVYVLDEDRRIIYCNGACARWTGISLGELLGARCVFCSDAEDRSAAAIVLGMCPPPKVFSGQPHQAVVSITRPDGRAVRRRGHFLPLSDGEDESAAVVAVLESSDCLADGPATASDTSAQLHEQLRALRRRMAGRYRVDSLLGHSPTIVRARAQIELAAATAASVLIVGPSGSGKDHVAKAIHYAQADPGPLVPLACATLEANLLRSALRAAWSPAVPGERATLLLNDVEGMPPEAQSELSELLGRDTRRVRVVATATRPLGELAARDEYSTTLACALSTIVIELAPLGERLQDLPLLAQAFVERANVHGTKQIGGFTRQALDHLSAYPWPGNVDELTDVVRQAHERAAGGEVTVQDLPKQIRWAAESGVHPPRVDESIVLEDFLARIEKELIARAMRRAKNNKSKAAKLLGLTRPRLYRRLVQLGLEQPGSEKQSKGKQEEPKRD